MSTMMTNLEQFEGVGSGLLVRAPAKINLSLLIAGKRPDGYHEIETIMAKINWYDEILIEPTAGSGIELVCAGSHWAPEGPDNLVYRAAERILAFCHRPGNVRLTLTKNIPAGTGLGSASSDAAAALIGLNKYLSLGLTRLELADLAAQLGSDVAFFFGGPLAFCTGRGEKVRELATPFDFAACLILPDVSVSTAKVYANYVHDQQFYLSLKHAIDTHIEENRIDLAAKMAANMLERPCFHLFAELKQLKLRIESLDIGPVCLSGSGSTLFCILSDGASDDLDDARDRIAGRLHARCIIVRNNKW
jgi:4-diphosphocytidyl-2-C-methyl-D-erythritol kinase